MTTHLTAANVYADIRDYVTERYAGKLSDPDMVLAELLQDAHGFMFTSETEYLRQARTALLQMGAKHSLIVKLDKIVKYIVTSKD